MNGINSYEERMRQPWKKIIDWSFINSHPEAKSAIWTRYKTDAIFRSKLNEEMARDYMFKIEFQENFKSYEQGRGR